MRIIIIIIYILCIDTPFLVIHMYCKNLIMSMLSEILYRIHRRGVYYQCACLAHCVLSEGVQTLVLYTQLYPYHLTRKAGGVLDSMLEKMTYMHQRTPIPVIDLLSEIYLSHKDIQYVLTH